MIAPRCLIEGVPYQSLFRGWLRALGKWIRAHGGSFVQAGGAGKGKARALVAEVGPSEEWDEPDALASRKPPCSRGRPCT